MLRKEAWEATWANNNKKLAIEATEAICASLEAKKKKKLSGQIEVVILSSPKAKQKLKMETKE